MTIINTYKVAKAAYDFAGIKAEEAKNRKVTRNGSYFVFTFTSRGLSYELWVDCITAEVVGVETEPVTEYAEEAYELKYAV